MNIDDVTDVSNTILSSITKNKNGKIYFVFTEGGLVFNVEHVAGAARGEAEGVKEDLSLHTHHH